MIKNILNKKWILIVIGVILFCLVIWLILSKQSIDNEFYTYESKNANDTKASLSSLFQTYEKSKAKFYVYGEGVIDSKNSMIVECDGTSKVVELSATPVTVDNHCILSIDYTNIKDNSLDAYVVSPDNSLITIKTKYKTKLQLNAYQNETRIVLQNGNIYNRIAKQKKDSKYTIQVANTLFESVGGQEVGVLSQIVDNKVTYALEDSGIISYGDKYYNKIETSTILGIASFDVINGSSSYHKRDSQTKETTNDFFYYFDDVYNSLTLDQEEVTALEQLYGKYKEDLDKLIEDQDELNKNDKLHFTGIVRDEYRVRDKDRTKKVMDEYARYWTKLIKDYNDSMSSETASSTTNTGNACDTYKAISGFTPTSICWCRNDFTLSSHGLEEVNAKGYNFSSSDFIYCFTYTTEDTGGGMGNSVEGYMLKECAIDLGWPENSYSNEGGYVCN